MAKANIALEVTPEVTPTVTPEVVPTPEVPAPEVAPAPIVPLVPLYLLPQPVAAAPKAAKWAGTAVITLVATANPKRGAAAKRFALYATGLTVDAYLAGCLVLQPDEPAYRWRADIAWDLARGFITVA